MELSGSFNDPANRRMQTTPTVHSWQGWEGQHTVLRTAPNSYCPLNQQQIWYQHYMQTHPMVPFGGPENMYHNPQPILQPQHQTNPRNNFPSPPVEGSGSGTPSPGSNNISHSHIPARLPDGSTVRHGYRMIYSEEQKNELEKVYREHNKYITVGMKNDLAERLRLTERQVKVWFQNRRAKERKIERRLEKTIEIGVGCNQTYVPQMAMPSQFHDPLVGCNPTVLQVNQSI